MRKVYHFIGLFLLFALPVVLFYSAKTAWAMIDDKYKSTIYGNEIYRAIEKSKKKTRYRKLILGDSTANQFYNCKGDNPDSAYSLTCNQAIGLVGQFILLNNYLSAGNKPDTVYLVYTPFSFWDNLDQVFTYHYFLKPFYYDEYKPLMSETVVQQIKKLPKYWACHIPFIQTTAWAPNIQEEKRDYTFLSPISKEYLTKMDSLSKSRHFKLEFVPTFVAHYWQDSVRHFRREEFAGHPLEQKLNNYLDGIEYLDDTCFCDDVHLACPELYKKRIDKKLNLR